MKSGFRLSKIDLNINNSIKSSKNFFSNKRVTLFSINKNLADQNIFQQLQNFESFYDRIKKLGIHEIYCCAIENFANLKSRFISMNINKIKIIPDEKGIFTEHLGMLISNTKDNTKYTKNYMAIITDGIIEKWWEDNQVSKDVEGSLFCTEMRAENCLDYLYGSE
tara:strand:- start:428 stop:922 length:495 start_codon:yes stop_codon:yes gene_type:complete